MNTDLIFPVSSERIALFIAFMHNKGYAKSTICTYVSAVGYFHRTLEMPDLSNNNLIKRCIAGLSPKKVQKKHPVSLSDLRKLSKAAKECLTSIEALQFCSVITLLFFGLFRISELLGDRRSGIKPLLRENARLHNDRINIKLLRYKHSKGSSAIVKIKSQKFKDICPVKSLKNYIDVSKPKDLLFCNKKGFPLTRNCFSNYLNKCSHHAGLNRKVTSHCFRIGAATYANNIGLSEGQIKVLGRWRSKAYQGYIRESTSLVIKY